MSAFSVVKVTLPVTLPKVKLTYLMHCSTEGNSPESEMDPFKFNIHNSVPSKA